MSIRLSDRFTYPRLLRFTLPSIAMMVFTSVYGVVDGYFISNYAGQDPFTAVNLVWPVIMILTTVGFMFGNGGTAIVAKTYGEGDLRKANRYFSLFVYFVAAVGALLGAVGILLARPISVLLGAEGAVLEHCVVYGRTLFAAVPFSALQLMFQSFFAAAEKPRLGFLVTFCAGVSNIILDAVLVPLLPDALKLAGAAGASAVSQIVGAVIPLIYFFSPNKSILRLGRTSFYGKALARAAVNGSSEFMNNISMNLVAILYNFQLLAYAGEDGVDAYGVLMYVSFIFAAMFIGYSIGSAPIVGYHFGAGNRAELRSIRKKSLFIIAGFGLCMTVLAEALSVPLAKLFVGYSKDLCDLTVRAFRINAVSFLFMGFGMYASNFFTALSDGLTSALISFLRTLVFQVAAILILPRFFGTDGIWMSLIVSEFMSMALSFVFLRIKRKKYGY